MVHIETVQWSSLPDIDDVEPISEKDHAVLDELRAVLVKHGFTSRFGVALLHKHFELADDEVLMETTDVDARMSTLSVEKRSARPERTIETLWRFATKELPDAVTVCVNRCHYDSGHKMRHHREGR